MVASLSNILKETRSEILSCLKAKGRMSVDEIACKIRVSKVSIRRHLALLSRDGLVEFEVERLERGRPSHLYRLTEKAAVLFPTGYNTFALDVLTQVGIQFGERAISNVICGQAECLIASLKPQLEGLGFEDKVKKLGKLINERGYEVALRKLPDGSFLMKERNCPMVAVAASYVQLCNEELRLYKELLGVEIIRDCRIAAGAQSCNYRILPPAEPARPARRN